MPLTDSVSTVTFILPGETPVATKVPAGVMLTVVGAPLPSAGWSVRVPPVTGWPLYLTLPDTCPELPREPTHPEATTAAPATTRARSLPANHHLLACP